MQQIKARQAKGSSATSDQVEVGPFSSFLPGFWQAGLAGQPACPAAVPLTLVAEQPAPAGRAVAAGPLGIARAPVLAVLARQAAVGAEGVLQADCNRKSRGETPSPGLSSNSGSLGINPNITDPSKANSIWGCLCAQKGYLMYAASVPGMHG